MPRILGIALLLIVAAGHFLPGLESEVIVEPVTSTKPAPETPEPGSHAFEVQQKAMENAKQIEKAVQDRADAVSRSIDEQTGAAADDDES